MPRVRVDGHLRKVPGRKAKVRVRGHIRHQRYHYKKRRYWNGILLGEEKGTGRKRKRRKAYWEKQ